MKSYRMNIWENTGTQGSKPGTWGRWDSAECADPAEMSERSNGVSESLMVPAGEVGV